MFPSLIAMFAAEPAVPVAVNVTGDPANPADVAVRVFTPAVVESVHAGDSAIPEASVVTFALTGSEKLTNTPDTGLPKESVTSTDGFVATAVPTTAVWLSPEFTAIVAAGPGPLARTVSSAEARPGLVKVKVSSVVVEPVKTRLLNATIPFVALIATVPVSDPLEDATVTVAVEFNTRWPLASWTFTIGCVVRALPDAPATGAVVIASCVATPNGSTIAEDALSGPVYRTLLTSAVAETRK